MNDKKTKAQLIIESKKQRQNVLWKNEKRFRALFDQSAVGVAEVITKTGNFVCLNQRYANIFGYTVEEMKHRTFQANTYPGDVQKDQEKMERLLNGEMREFSVEKRYLHKNGSIVWVNQTVSIIGEIEDDPKSHMAVMEDITQRKLNEEINASRLHLLQFSMTHSLLDLLEETLNEAEKLTSSCIGFYHFVNDDQNSITLQNWSTRTKSTFCKTEGHGLHYAISEAGVWVDCVYERKPVIHNDYSSLPHRKGMPENHAEVIRELVLPVIRDNKIKAILGIGNKLTDYTQQDIEIVSLLADLAWDIAERKQAEEKIRNLNEELEQRVIQRTAQLEIANKELKEFAYIVSHDLKAPLRAVCQLATWIHNDYEANLDDTGKKYLNFMVQRVQRMDLLINGVLEFSRIGRVKDTRQKIELTELVNEVIESLSPLKQIKIEVEKALPIIYASRIRITQLFQNLIHNAIKYMDKPQGLIQIKCNEKESEWLFSVADNGPGIEKKYFERIFKLFQTLQARDEVEATGIGLALVKKILENAGGKIWLESRIGKGSTFYFTLPK